MKSLKLKMILLPLLAFLIIAVALASEQSGYSMQQSMHQSIGTTGDMSGLEDDFFNFSFPEYSSHGFSSLGSDTSYNINGAYSFFSEYYVKKSTSSVSGIISTPVKIDISGETPSRIYFASGQPVSYSQYSSAFGQAGVPELWIRGAQDWTQYAVCPAGTGFELVAYIPDGSSADFYEITQTDASASSTDHKAKQFFPGYNSMSFSADKVGRHILFFVLNNQPSNVVIIDVLSQVPSVSASLPATSSPYSGQSGQPPYSMPSTTSQPQYSPALVGDNIPATTSGDVPVTIQSSKMRGYQVFLDGVYIGKETKGDGTFSFMVQGNMNHDIRVFDGQFNYPKSMYFQSGVAKIIRVEPGSAVYI